MPYSPGVTDISGQLRAQGILGSANAYSGGMQAITQGIQQRKLKQEQDAMLLAKASSTEKFIKAHPEMFGGEEVVKEMIATNPTESPIAKYSRLATVMADTVTGKKLEADQAQMQQAKQAMAAQAFALQRQKQLAQQEEAQRARFEQMMGSLQRGGSAPQGMPPPSLNQAAPAGVLAGIPGAGPAMGGGPSAPGMAPQPDPMTARALQYYQMTGRVPDSNAMSAMIGDESRANVAEISGRYRDAIADEREATRKAIADREAAIKEAKQKDANGAARYDTDPITGIRSVYSGAQWVPLPGQVAKDPTFAEIDKLASIPVKDGGITLAQANAAKKKLIAHRGTFSPNSGQALAQGIAAINNPGAPAAASGEAAFWEVTPQAAGAPPTLTPEQARAAKPGKFTGTNGQLYEKLPNGTIRKL